MKKIFGIGITIIVIIVGYLYISSSESVTFDYPGGYGGLTASEAQSLAESRGVLFRITEIDGQAQPTTKDRRKGRVNAEIADGVVVGYMIEE